MRVDKHIDNLLLSLFSGNAISKLENEKIPPSQWEELLHSCASQGLLSVVWDKLQNSPQGWECLLNHCPTPVKLRWALSAERIEGNYNKRKQLSCEFADILAEQGVKLYCLKGLALSACYPKPSAREFSDFDCWTEGLSDQVVRIAQANGAIYNPHDYRHSVLYYKNLMIENHRYFLPIRGNALNKRLERYLQTVAPYDKKIEGTNIFYISPQAHSLFVVLHMLQHFLYENITIRHLLDWRFFVEAERDNIDWREFNQKCDEAGAIKFVEAINDICVRYLGLSLNGTLLRINNNNTQRVLDDIINCPSIHVSNVQSLWKQRFTKVKNMVAQNWKYNEIYDRSLLRSMLQSATGILFDSKVNF